MSDYIDCPHRLTVGMSVHLKFGDVFPLSAYKCLSCDGIFIKNHLLPGSPVESMDTPMAQAWMKGYPNPESIPA